MSCCLSSSRLKITSRFGRYSFSMISTNFFPKDPVPPVTRTACSDQFIPCASLWPKSDNRVAELLHASVLFTGTVIPNSSGIDRHRVGSTLPLV